MDGSFLRPGAQARRYITKPAVPVVPNAGHRLAPDHAWMCWEGAGVTQDIVGLTTSAAVGTGTAGSSVWRTGTHQFGGAAIEFTSTGQTLVLGANSLLLPTSGGFTAVLGYKKTDATNRVAGAFGVNTGTVAEACGAFIPFSDGITYFDFGGVTNGTTRVQVSGLTFGDDIWVFTTGPRGMEIWQNGLLRASNAANPSRTASAANFTLGNNGGNASDLAIENFLFTYNRQLDTSEAIWVSMRPFDWLAGMTGMSKIFIAELLRDARIPADWSQTTLRDALIPVSWGGQISRDRDARIPLSWSGPAARDARIPVSWFSQSLRDAPISLAWGGVNPFSLGHGWNVRTPLVASLNHIWSVGALTATFSLRHDWEVLERIPGLVHEWRVLPNLQGAFSNDIQQPVANPVKTP